MSKLILQHRRGDEDAWFDEQSPIPAEGELVVQTAEGDKSPVLKIGDGENKFKDLPSVTKDVEAAVATEKSRLDVFFGGNTGATATLEDEVHDIRVRYAGAVATCAGEAVRAIDKDLHDLKASVQNFVDKEAVDGIQYEDNMLWLTAGGEQVGRKVGPISGGTGTGSGNLPSDLVVTLQLQDKDGLTVKLSDEVVLARYVFTSVEGTDPTGTFTCTITNKATGQSLTFSGLKQGYQEHNIKSILSEGKNDIEVACKDVYKVERFKSFTVVVASVKLKLETDVNSSVFKSENYPNHIEIRYIADGAVDKKITTRLTGLNGQVFVSSFDHLKDDAKKELTYYALIENLKHGRNTLKIEAETITSDPIKESIECDILYAAENSNIPMIGSTYLGTKTITQGNTLTIPYIIYDPAFGDSPASAVRKIYNPDGSLYSTQTVVVNNNAKGDWSTRDFPAGDNVKFEISYVKQGSASISVEHLFNVVENVSTSTVSVDNMLLNFKAEGRDNGETTDRDKWTSTVEQGGAENTLVVDGVLSNYNWKSNGWVPGLDNDICLRTNGDARGCVEYKLFDTTNINPINSGMTIELEFNVHSVNKRTAIPLKCEKDGVGLVVTPQSAKLSASAISVECNFKEEERVKIAFTMERKSNSTSRFLAVYLNGVLSQIKQYSEDVNAASFAKASNEFLTFGSSECTLDLYTLRVYNRCLTAQEVRLNYIADITNTELQDKIYQDNNILTDQGDISVDLVSKKIPCIYFTAPEGMPTYKGDKKVVWMDFINPQDPDRSFDTVYGGPIQVEIDVQGTSSQGYVRKNWKIKLKKKDDAGNVIFDSPAYQHMPGQKASKVFCIKVDYAESTGTHNTQNANFVETLYSEKVPPADKDSEIRTTIAGFPCVIFERTSPTGSYVFSSKGNFNFDKGSEEAFGFEDYDDAASNIVSAECWEFCNNTSGPCNFTSDIDVNSKWFDDFEARFLDSNARYINASLPDWYGKLESLEEDLVEANKDPITNAETIAKLEAQAAPLRPYFGTTSKFPELHKWVTSTATFALYLDENDNLVRVPRDDVNTDIETFTEPYIGVDGTEYWRDTNEYRKAKFEKEFENYFNLHYCLIYYVYTSVALMMDQRSKNMFLTRWTTKDINGNQETKWYPYFYDNDTCFGINNEGALVYDYYHEDIDEVDGVPVYNGQYNVLWTNFREKFASKIRQTYQSLRSGGDLAKLTYDKLIHQFIDEGSSKWSAAIYNEDAEYKYVSLARPDYPSAEKPDPTPEYLYQVRGDGALHLQYFLSNRIKYCDSKWNAGDYPDDTVVLRVNTPSAIQYTPGDVLGNGNSFTFVYTEQESSIYTFAVKGPQGKETFATLQISYTDASSVHENTTSTARVKIPPVGFTAYSFACSYPGTYTVTILSTENLVGSDSMTLHVANISAEQDNAISTSLQVVSASPQITLTPYSTMYTGVKYKANGTLEASRVYAGRVATFGTRVTETFADTETFVYGASELSSLGNLSAAYVSVVDVHKATKLSELNVGSQLDGYCNKQLRQVTVGSSNKLLQKVDISNCLGLSESLNLKDCTGLKHVYAIGSSIPSVALPVGGYVETLDLPDSITTLTIDTQPNVFYKKENSDGVLTSTLRVRSSLQSLTDNFLNIESLHVTGCDNIDSLALLYDCLGYIPGVSTTKDPLSKLEYVTIDNLNIELTNLDQLRMFYEADKFNLKSMDAQGNILSKLDFGGTCVIKNHFMGDEFAEVAKHFSENLRFVVEDESEGSVRSTVYFYGDVDEEHWVPKQGYLTSKETRDAYGTVDNPIDDFREELYREPDQEYTYDLQGWSLATAKKDRQPDSSALINILGDRHVFPAYTFTRNKYTVTFTTCGQKLYDQLYEYGTRTNSDIPLEFDVTRDDIPQDLIHWEPGNPTERVPKNVDSARYDLYEFEGWYPDINDQTEIIDNTSFAAQFDLFEGDYYTAEQINIADGYELVNGGIRITKYTVNEDELHRPNVIVNIPETFDLDEGTQKTVEITNRTVDSAIVGAFQGTAVELVVIPNSVTTIGINAFNSCSKLTKLTLGTGVNSIYSGAFSGCSKLKTVYYNCASASRIIVSGFSDAFSGCRSETGFEVIVGPEVQKIPAQLFFQGARGDTKVAVKTLNLTDAVACSVIESSAFSGCNIHEIKFNSSGVLREIGSSAFECNPYQTYLELPQGLERIGSSAFSQWTALEEVKLPASVQRIAGGAFSYCDNLEKFTIDNANKNYVFSTDNNLKALLEKRSGGVYALISSTKNTDIDGTVEFSEISSSSCAGNPRIVNVKLPQATTHIGSGAFANCKELLSIDCLSSGVSTIASNAFYGCTKLHEVKLPSSLTNLGSSAFGACLNLTSITIPESVYKEGSIGFDLFSDCPNLSSVTLLCTNPSADLVVNNKQGERYMFGRLNGPLTVYVSWPDTTTVAGETHKWCSDPASRDLITIKHAGEWNNV